MKFQELRGQKHKHFRGFGETWGGMRMESGYTGFPVARRLGATLAVRGSLPSHRQASLFWCVR